MENTGKEFSLTYMLAGGRQINRMGYGAMQLTGKGVWGDPEDRANAINILKEAVKLGVNFIDTADAYGPYTNETLIADALHPYDGNLLIATKGGFERPSAGKWTENGTPEHIEKAIEGSLERLKVNTIELWQLHRFDPNVPIEKTLEPVAKAVQSGKIKYVGLSEVDINQIEEAEKIVPIVSVQNLYNLGERKWDEVVDYTAKRNMAFIPWYPLASGPQKLENAVSRIAEAHNATTAQIALAWLLHRSPNIILIPGTSSLQHLKENIDSAKIILSPEEIEQLED